MALEDKMDTLIDLTTQQVDISGQRLQLELQQAELWRRGFTGIVHASANRVRLNPETFDQQVPQWYEDLGRVDQGMIRTILHINYYATVTRDTGMTSIESWTGMQGIRFERKDLENMWEKLPGFRMALATMSHDLFEADKDHFIISEQGYEILQDYDVLQNYKDGLVEGIAQKLRNDPEAAQTAARYLLKNKNPNDTRGDAYEQLARLAVSSADNLFYSTGAYVSGDEKRLYERDAQGNLRYKIMKLADDNIAPDAIRTFLQPLRKMLEQSSEREEPSERAGAGRVERAPLGPMGEWMRWNIIHTPGFKERVINGEEGYLPLRMYYSMLEQTDVKVSENGENVSRSVAEMLVKNEDSKTDLNVSVTVNSKDSNGNAIQREVRVYDYEGEADYMDWGTIKASNIAGDYADERSSAVALYKHLTSDDPRDRLKPNKFVNSMAKLRKHRLLNPIYNKEPILIAGVGLIISPEKGFVEGDKLILDIDQASYQASVNDLLTDDRLFWGHQGGNLRKKMLKAYHSGDEHNLLQVMFDVHFGTVFLSPRQRELRRIKKKKQEILEGLE